MKEQPFCKSGEGAFMAEETPVKGSEAGHAWPVGGSLGDGGGAREMKGVQAEWRIVPHTVIGAI